MSSQDSIDRFRLQRDKARGQLREAKRSLQQKLRRVSLAQERVRGLEERLAGELLRKWGARPDWSTLLDGREASALLAAAYRRHAENLGLIGMLEIWPDTRQRILAIEPGMLCRSGIEAVARTLKDLQPAIAAHKDGHAWLRVRHRGETVMAWRLEFHVNGQARIRMEFIPESGRPVKAGLLRFSSLEAALEHVARNAERLRDERHGEAVASFDKASPAPGSRPVQSP